MNVAVIIAGGTGSRMHMDIPKQFINIYDKPVIIYTLEGFQKHPEIDAIEVVCLDGWRDALERYAAQYGITKLKWIVPGGNSGQESIRNGVYHLEDKLSPGDILIIHDGIRPMVDSSVLSDVIRVCMLHGNGVTATPFTEQIFRANDESTTTEYIPRDSVRKVATPQAYKYGILLEAYRRAFAEKIGIYGSAYTNTMMVDLGHTLYFAAGSDKNIKLTTKDDLELFKAYLRMEKEV
jgi:2-C-methyl-D-erythritol 4-phosphate cytidylyltransferase